VKLALPATWVAAPLGDLGSWLGGGTPNKSRAEYWRGGTIPWVSPKDMKVERIRGAADRVTQRAVEESSTAIVASGSLLVVVRSGILRHSLPVAVNTIDVALNQDMKALRPAIGLSASYVAWALRRFEEEILRGCSKSGTTVQSIEFSRLLDYEIPFPPLAEQGRIVAAIEEHVSRLDSAVAGLNRAQALIPRYRAAVLKAAVEGRLVPGRGAWQTVPVGELALKVEYGTSARAAVEGDIPVLRMGNIVDGRLDLESLKFLPKNHHEFPRLLLAPGDVLFNRTNSAALVGKTAVYHGTPAPCSVASYLIRVRLNSACLPDYLATFLNSVHGRGWVAEVVSQQVGQANVSGAKLKALRVPTPPVEEQKRIVSEVERRMSLVEAVRHEVEAGLGRAARLRQSILKCAFEGKLVPQDPTDEPASVLLERIRASRASAPSRPTRARRRA